MGKSAININLSVSTLPVIVAGREFYLQALSIKHLEELFNHKDKKTARVARSLWFNKMLTFSRQARKTCNTARKQLGGEAGVEALEDGD